MSSSKKTIQKSINVSLKISDRIEQTLRLFVKGLSERKGIDKNLWVKKFIKNIIYSKEEIVLTLYYKRSFDEELSASPASGRVGAAAGRSPVSLADKKITPITSDRGNHQEWLPSFTGERTIDIIIPNSIHGCKKKDL